MESSGVNPPPPIIDLTIEPKDHLTALPSEIQHLIIGYLYPTHEPDKAFQDLGDESRNDVEKVKSVSQPLDYLAATCRSLRHEIMVWSRIFLTKHDEITKYKALKSNQRQAQRSFLRGRGGLLTWSEKSCVFCGKKSSRSAILMNGFRCCAPCDKQQWPEKITRTDAKKQYDLKDHHLLPGKDFAPSMAKMLAKHPGGLPKLRYGTYMSSNVATTVFLRRDVEALAKFTHGDLKEHLAKRQATRNERQRRREEREKEGRNLEAGDLTAKTIDLLQHFSAYHQELSLTATTPDLPDQMIDGSEEIGMPANEPSFNLEFADVDNPIMRIHEPMSTAYIY